MQAPSRNQLSSIHLDMLRGLSAVTVVVGHLRSLVFVDFGDVQNPGLLTKLLYFLTGYGHQAVMVFFVLSGYFVTSHIKRSMETDRWSFKSYLVARWSRLSVALLPALLAGLVLDRLGSSLFAASGVYSSAAGFGHVVPPVAQANLGLGTILANVFFLQTIAAPTLGTNGPLWSLTNEFWYYLLFPLLTLVLADKRAPGWKRAAYAVAAVGIAVLLGPVRFAYFGVWLLGALLTWLPSCSPKAGTWALACSAFAFVASMVLARFGRLHPELLADSLVALSFTGLVYGIMNAEQRSTKGTFYERAAQSLSAVSYTLYLVHMPLLVFLCAGAFHGVRQAPGLGGLVASVGLLGAVALYTGLMWYVAERRNADFRSFVERVVSRAWLSRKAVLPE